MKLILTGATGFIGGAVLKECIATPSVSSVFVLTRKDLPEQHGEPKVKIILHDNFLEYPQHILDQLAGADGCIWCIGGKATDFPDLPTARRVGVDFTLAAATAFSKSLAPQLQEGRRFRFVFCSGWGAEMDPKKKLWMMADTRKIKGDVERGLFEIAEANNSTFEAYSLRPGGVLSGEGGIMNSLIGTLAPSVKVNVLASALLKTCEAGSAKKVLENEEVVQLGSGT